MLPVEALRTAVAELEQYRYVPEKDDYWDTLRDVERNLGADCDGFAVACIQKVWERCAEPRPLLRLVVGEVSSGGHAWVELVDAEGATWWADSTPGWPKVVQPPAWWARTPRWGYQYTGMGFTEKVRYEPASA